LQKNSARTIRAKSPTRKQNFIAALEALRHPKTSFQQTVSALKCLNLYGALKRRSSTTREKLIAGFFVAAGVEGREAF
jgi:hypothetical protein